MSLDLSKIAPQVGEMVGLLERGARERQEHLRGALNVMSQADPELLQRKLATARTTWLVAGLVEGLDRRRPVPPLPGDFTVIATDGSHIDVDRHRGIRCYLINIGRVLLHYGDPSDALLDCVPRLFMNEEDLVVRPAGARGREQPVEGGLLAVKRAVEECGELARLAAGLPPDSVSLALLDGSLILWGLEAYPEFVTDELLNKGFLSHLDRLKKLNEGKRVAVASYISFPRSTDVVNVLRVVLCPHEPVDCDRYCAANDKKECEAVAGVRDRDIFSSLLGEGERSALFLSRSSINGRHYGEHQVHFFYLKAGDEIARVEVPGWVAADSRLLEMTHALILDQCRRGDGYPVVLSEAHEQAVVTGADRENFWQLVELALGDVHLPFSTSAKSRSKRTRWI